ncbi:MAG TPA: NADH-quinone oxidoreductase subunit M [Chromatiaceae bacterium]|nr:NADH-quinone oxidoreductase subunit M [Chromatiaceae bacterium]
MHWLTLLLLIPMLGALMVAAIPGQQAVFIRRMAIFASTVALSLACGLWFLFDSTATQFQLSESVVWNERLGTAYALAIDGISYPMVLLAALLSLIALLASGSITDRPKGYYLLVLVLESAMLGVFMARDWALFYVFWELTLIPLFFLIDRWGGKNRQGASLNFVLYTMGGSVFMLISLLLLFEAVPGHSFSMAAITEAGRALPEDTQIWIFLGLLVGFGVKMPIFPIHGWLPLAHVEAPSPISILLSGILLKMGAYGLIRAADTLPAAIMALQTFLMALALISLIYGGLLAWRQTDLKAMIAYSSVSHMAVVLLGIAALNISGLTGAVMQMVAHGLVAGATFLLIGLLYQRTHTRDINQYSSLIRVAPRFAFFTTLAFMAAVALPGTAGFIAELHVLIGGFQQWQWWVLILSVGVLISAAYAVRTVGRLFTGPVRADMQDVLDLQRTETLAASILIAGILLIGIFPAPLLSLLEVSVTQMTTLFAGGGR